MNCQEVLQQLSDAFTQRNSESQLIGFRAKSWEGTKEQLHEYQYCLKELSKAGDIELKIEPDLSGDEFWWIKKITPQGHMKLAEKIPMN
jgi:hypothetical protein